MPDAFEFAVEPSLDSMMTPATPDNEPEPASSADSSNDDKRRDGRVSYNFPVFFYFATGKRRPREVVYHKGFTQDVSKNGIKMLLEKTSKDTLEKLAKGTELELEIYLPSVFRTKPIGARGVVVWCEPSKDVADSALLGVDLTDLDGKNRDVLKEVAQRLRMVTDDILGGELP